jgi:hypothetical protein
MKTFEQELAELINRYSQENASNTPDFILARYLCNCLDNFARAMRQREAWYGGEYRATSTPVSDQAVREVVVRADAPPQEVQK